MYGLLNQALQAYVTDTFGVAKWQEIAPGLGAFDKLSPYPDDLTVNLVTRTAAVLHTTPDAVLAAFGEYWVKYTDEQGYKLLFDIAGPSLKHFLMSLNALHDRVQQSFPKLKPPTFKTEEFDSNTLILRYFSDRQGLCPIVPGILRGLSKRFDTPIVIAEQLCARHRSDHCMFSLTF